MPNSNPACRPPYSDCGQCFVPEVDLPRYVYLVGPPPINQVLELSGSYYWFTPSGTGWPHAFECIGNCIVQLTDGVTYQTKSCSEGSCDPIQYDFGLDTGSFSVSEVPPAENN